MTNTLLVTDDALLIRSMIKDLAGENGWETVAEAADGQQAIDEYRRVRPTAVTLDLVMPDFDGLHALRGIKQCDPDAKVIVVSALNQQELLKQAFVEGAVDFVCKPFRPDQLIGALQKALGNDAADNV